MPYDRRKELYDIIEKSRDSKVVLYATSDRAGMETQISHDAFDFFVHHLDVIWPIKKITLILHTSGGDTAAAWRIVNLLRIFSDDLEVIVPNKAHSAGTLISLGANVIVMTKQATLGPIDPSLSGPLSPSVPGAPHQRVPVSVEAVQGYIDLARGEVGIQNDGVLGQILNSLSQQVHPLVLGQIFRSRNQIRSLAEDLLNGQLDDKSARGKIIDFLCSESGSHDRTINRREARQLGLNVETPTQELYDVINELYENVAADLELRSRFDPMMLLTQSGQGAVQFECQRVLLESISGGSSVRVTRGSVVAKVLQQQIAPGLPPVQTQAAETRVIFDGWEKR